MCQDSVESSPIAERAAEPSENRTPTTPRMGPGWVAEQRSRWEKMAQVKPQEYEPEREGFDVPLGANPDQLHSLTLLMWQLQSQTSSISALGSGDEQLAKACSQLGQQLEDAMSEAESLIQEHSEAVSGASFLSTHIQALQKDQEDAARRIQVGG